MEWLEWNEFIDTILKRIEFKYDHTGIRREILEHMEDMYEDFVAEGMEEEIAVNAVVESMGDPDEIGIELNKEHRPLLGWIWRISRTLAIILVVICLVPGFNFTMGVLFSVFSSYPEGSDSNIVYEIEVNKWGKDYGYYFYFDELRYYEYGTMEVRYGVFTNPFSSAMGWTSDVRGFYDENGIQYFGGGSSNAGYYRKNQSNLQDFPKEAEQFIIKYGRHDDLKNIVVYIPKEVEK